MTLEASLRWPLAPSFQCTMRAHIQSATASFGPFHPRPPAPVFLRPSSTLRPVAFSTPTMDSVTLPAFLQTHLLDCRLLADPDRYSIPDQFDLRNGNTAFELTREEETHVHFFLPLVNVHYEMSDAELVMVEKLKETHMGLARDVARRAGEALVSARED